MKSCKCGANVFLCDLRAIANITIGNNGVIRFNSIGYKDPNYIRCSGCGAVYQYSHGKIIIPKDTLAMMCSGCGPNGVKCLDCVMLTYRLNYNLSRIDDVGLWQLLPVR